MRAMETVIGLLFAVFPYVVLLLGLILLWSIANAAQRMARSLERLVSRVDLVNGRQEREEFRPAKVSPFDEDAEAFV